MDTTPTCYFCGKSDRPFEHAAYQEGQTADERQYLGWLCQVCARQHGSHSRFAEAMLTQGPGVWLVSAPGTTTERSYTVQWGR